MAPPATQRTRRRVGRASRSCQFSPLRCVLVALHWSRFEGGGTQMCAERGAASQGAEAEHRSAEHEAVLVGRRYMNWVGASSLGRISAWVGHPGEWDGSRGWANGSAEGSRERWHAAHGLLRVPVAARAAAPRSTGWRCMPQVSSCGAVNENCRGHGRRGRRLRSGLETIRQPQPHLMHSAGHLQPRSLRNPSATSPPVQGAWCAT